MKDVVDELTKMVLVNAIYFKGKWQQQFKEEDTVNAPFRISKVMLQKADGFFVDSTSSSSLKSFGAVVSRCHKNGSKSVMMMHQKSKFPFAYHPEEKLQVPSMFLASCSLVFICGQSSNSIVVISHLTPPHGAGPGASLQRGADQHDCPAAG